MLCLYRIRRLLAGKQGLNDVSKTIPIHIQLGETLSKEPNYLIHAGKKFNKQQILLESEQLVTPLHIKKQYLFRDNLNMIILEETDKPEEVSVIEWHRLYLLKFEYKEHFINYQFASMGSGAETKKTIEMSTAKTCYASYSHLSSARDEILARIENFCSEIDWK